jgi:hypothetical protein
MAVDTDKIEEAVLALLLLGLHGPGRAWKGFDWDALDRLYERDLIHDPKGKQKSVLFTDEGLTAAKAAFDRLFGAPDP